MLYKTKGAIAAYIFVRCCRQFSTKQRAFHEIKIPVPWGHIAGKWWEPFEQRPVLAVHGWQDNCGSFDRLIPLLTDDVGFLAIDLPGHGYSSRLPPGMYYHNINYPILIKQILHYFNWTKVSLLGHSLGAISCYVYTMLFPQSVDFLICVDGMKPIYKKNNGPRMAEGIQELLRYDELTRTSNEPPSYPLDILKKKLVEQNNKSISIDHCHHILDRNIQQSKTDSNKYFLTRDPRLKARLILNWAQQELIEGTQRVSAPVLLIKFTDSGYFEDKENFYELLAVLKQSSQDAQYHYVTGTHHTHLNNPQAISGLINNFINTHNVQDRSISELKNVIL